MKPHLVRLFILGHNPAHTLLRAVFIVAPSSYLIFNYVLLFSFLAGSSMEPTYKNNSIKLINLLKYKYTQPKRADVVAISIIAKEALYLKRILGLPGEQLAFKKGQLYINGKPHNEDYLFDTGDWNLKTVDIPQGYYFVAGDNRSVRQENVIYGLTPEKNLKGAMLFQ